MKSVQEIKSEIKALGRVSLWGVGKELKELHYKLLEDEHIAGLCRAFSQSTIVLLVATDRRLIIMDSFTFYGTDHKDISYMQISGVDYNTRLFFGKIIIEDQTGRNFFDYALTRDLRRFVNILLERVNAYRDRMVVNAPPAKMEGAMVADEIEKLWDLKEKGVLTQGEFEQRKRKLLEK